MSVWVRQLSDDVLDGEYVIKPVDPKDTDLDLLNRKAASHDQKGWIVTWLIPSVSFSVTKVYQRNGALVRKRIFEIR